MTPTEFRNAVRSLARERGIVEFLCELAEFLRDGSSWRKPNPCRTADAEFRYRVAGILEKVAKHIAEKVGDAWPKT